MKKILGAVWAHIALTFWQIIFQVVGDVRSILPNIYLDYLLIFSSINLSQLQLKQKSQHNFWLRVKLYFKYFECLIQSSNLAWNLLYIK